MSRYNYYPRNRSNRRRITVELPMQPEPVVTATPVPPPVNSDFPTFLKSKYYPVDYSNNVIYNEPHRREMDCSILSPHTSTIGRKGDALNKYPAYREFTVLPAGPSPDELRRIMAHEYEMEARIAPEPPINPDDIAPPDDNRDWSEYYEQVERALKPEHLDILTSMARGNELIHGANISQTRMWWKLAGKTVKKLFTEQLHELGYITPTRSTRLRSVYVLTDAGRAAVTPAPDDGDLAFEGGESIGGEATAVSDNALGKITGTFRVHYLHNRFNVGQMEYQTDDPHQLAQWLRITGSCDDYAVASSNSSGTVLGGQAWLDAYDQLAPYLNHAPPSPLAEVEPTGEPGVPEDFVRLTALSTGSKASWAPPDSAVIWLCRFGTANYVVEDTAGRVVSGDEWLRERGSGTGTQS